ncbi:MAG: hypothetical protein ABW201_12890 [Candidatus Thiodiazotropha sp.]
MRVFFLPKVNDLMALTNDTSVEIVEVSVVTPHWLNGSENWRMDRLSQVREGRQMVSGNTLRAFIYALLDGRELVDGSRAADDQHIHDIQVLWPSKANTE